MTASDKTAGPEVNFDPEKSPRIVEMAAAISKRATTFRALIEAGFSAGEIGRFHEKARSLALTSIMQRAAFSTDRLSEMIEKANAAIPGCMPMPKNARETQAMVVAWNRYCLARADCRLEPLERQRERCEAFLKAFFRQTPAGPAVTDYVVLKTMKAMGARH